MTTQVQVFRHINSAIASLRQAQEKERRIENERIALVRLAAQRSGYPSSEAALERDSLDRKIENIIGRLEELLELA